MCAVARSAAAKTDCNMSRTRLGTPEQPQPAHCEASDTVARLRCMQLHRPAGRWSLTRGLSERQANAVALLLYQWHAGGPGRTQAAHGWGVAASGLAASEPMTLMLGSFPREVTSAVRTLDAGSASLTCTRRQVPIGADWAD
jgi:hypothetical protein